MNLTKLNKEQLQKRMIKNTDILERLSQHTESSENNMLSLNGQRETLVEHYVKAQKMALSIWVHSEKRSQHQALSKWLIQTKTISNYEATL